MASKQLRVCLASKDSILRVASSVRDIALLIRSQTRTLRSAGSRFWRPYRTIQHWCSRLELTFSLLDVE